MLINRFLIVGLGSAGSRHLQYVRMFLPQADIRVLRHKRSEQGCADSDGLFFRPDEALAFKPQAAIVANPAPMHIKISLLLAEAGCHLLVEKPLADQLKGVRSLIRKAAQNKCVLQVGYNLRFLPSLEKFKFLIQSGTIGRVLCIHAEVGQYLPLWRPKSDYRTGVSARKKLGGGVLLELSHEIDYLRWIFGEIVWVSAWAGKIGDFKLDVEDSAKIQLGFSEVHGQPGPVASLNMDFVRQDSVRFCEATGTDGTLRWDGIRGEIAHFSFGSGWRKLHKRRESRDQSYANQLKSFLHSVRDRRSPKVTGKDGLLVLKVIKAAKQSNARMGKRIPLTSLK